MYPCILILGMRLARALTRRAAGRRTRVDCMAGRRTVLWDKTVVYLRDVAQAIVCPKEQAQLYGERLTATLEPAG